MTPNRLAAARGGRVTTAQSAAKAAALDHLHASRRGKRVHVSSRRLRETVLGELHTLLTTQWQRGEISCTRCAADIGINERTLRRWLSGEDWPEELYLYALSAWIKRHRKK